MSCLSTCWHFLRFFVDNVGLLFFFWHFGFHCWDTYAMQETTHCQEVSSRTLSQCWLKPGYDITALASVGLDLTHHHQMQSWLSRQLWGTASFLSHSCGTLATLLYVVWPLTCIVGKLGTPRVFRLKPQASAPQDVTLFGERIITEVQR